MNTKHEKKQNAKYVKQAASTVGPAPTVGTKVVIGNLPDNATDKSIKELLLRPLSAPSSSSESQFVTSFIENPIKNHHIKSIRVATDAVTKKCRGFCHVEFADIESTKVALSMHKKASLLGSNVTVKVPRDGKEKTEDGVAADPIPADVPKKRKRGAE